VSQSRYREARTLVRRLCRLPGEDQAQFNHKIARLHEHFERFNVDVSELCQWLMGLRRQQADTNQPGSFGTLGDFILEPDLVGVEADESERDRWRLAVFDDVAGFRAARVLANRPVPDSLHEAMKQAAKQPKTPTAERLFERMRALEAAHRLVLLKAAAEWIVARYRRGIENWTRQHAEWEKEKKEWESQHPALSEEIRDRFTDVFKALKDPERDGSQGIRRKNPRICPYDRLRQNKNNCIYAGEKGHGPLCWKYLEFLRAQEGRTRGLKKYFPENAEKYIEQRRNKRSKQAALERLYKSVPQCKGSFERVWEEYLKALGLSEETVLQYGRLPHCLKIGNETWERSQCQWNPHTELCRQYKDALDKLDDETLKLEPEYREWRRLYLAGPRKPSFRYPSRSHLINAATG